MIDLFRSNFWRRFSEYLTRHRYDCPQFVHTRTLEQFKVQR